MEKKIAPTRNSSAKLRRLQMHAPSAIQVAPPPPSPAAAGWNVVIPLLSPLNCAAGGDRAEEVVGQPVVREGREAAGGKPAVEMMDDEGKQPVGGGSLRTPWRHPAMPLHYQPAPANPPPAFVFPHCT